MKSGSRSNNSSFKQNQGFKNAAKRTSEKNIAEKVCGILNDGIKQAKTGEKVGFDKTIFTSFRSNYWMQYLDNILQPKYSN